MRNLVLAAAVLAIAGLTLPASAVTCGDEMKTVPPAWDKTTGAKKKDAAAVDVKAVEQALAKKDERACLDSPGKARTAIK